MASVYPEWKALADRIQALCRREEEILQLIAASMARQRVRDRSVIQEPGVSVVQPPKPTKPLNAATRALLDGFAPADEKPSAAGPVVTYTRICDIECQPLAAELNDVRAAMAVIHPLLTAAHREASKRLCAARMDDYRAIVAKLCGAIVDIGDAMLAYRDFQTELTAAGAPETAYFRPMDVAAIERVLGNPQERYSLIRRLLAGAAEGGHFDLTTIPDAWTVPPAVATPGAAAVATAARQTRGAAAPAAPAAGDAEAPVTAPGGGVIRNAWRALAGGERAAIIPVG
jgi:hypothetical protein